MTRADAQSRPDALRQALFTLRAKKVSKVQAYSCFLEEQSIEYAATSSVPDGFVDAGLVVNASLHVQGGDDPPQEILASGVPLYGFECGHVVAWIRDAGTGLWAPFWAPPQFAAALRRFRPGEAPPADVPAPLLWAFMVSHILVRPDHDETRRAMWKKACAVARSEHDARGYTVIRGLIHPLQVGAMQAYYRRLVGRGVLPLGDDQVPNRYWLHSEAVGSFLHPQLTPLLSGIAGEPVKPSYVYFASYEPGAALPRHLDREQCEFSLSLLVDYIPQSDGASAWPLFMEHARMPGVGGAVHLSVGDAVMYRGREVVHYREALPAGHRSRSLFLHYVRESYSGRMW
jgi:hypothetical protein